EQHQVGALRGIPVEGVVAGRRQLDLVALVLEELLECRANARLIIHHENPVAHRAAVLLYRHTAAGLTRTSPKRWPTGRGTLALWAPGRWAAARIRGM